MQINIVTTIEDTLQEKTIELRKQIISEICDSMIQAMEDKLPSEAQTIDTFDYILEECKKTIHRRKISLK